MRRAIARVVPRDNRRAGDVDDAPSRHAAPDQTEAWRGFVCSGNPLRVALLRDPSVLFAGLVSLLSASDPPLSRVEGNS